MMKPIELEFMSRRGQMEVTSLVTSQALCAMVVTSVRASGTTRKSRVILGRKILQPKGVMRTGWRLHLRQGDPLSIEFQGDGRVSVYGYRVPELSR